MLHIPAYNSLSLLFFQTCFIDDSSHRFTNLPFPNKKSGPKPREFLPFFKPPRGVWLTPWCFPHFFRCEIRLRLGYGSIVALVAQEIRGAAWRIFGWSLGVGHFRGTRPVAFFSTRVALKNRLCWCWCWRGSGKNFQFFFLQDGDVVSEILFYLKQIRSVVGSLCGSVCWLNPQNSKARIHKTRT